MRWRFALWFHDVVAIGDYIALSTNLFIRPDTKKHLMTSKEPKEAGGKPDNVHVPEVARKVDKGQLAQFVTTIKSAEQQVGENIISALHHENTVAVLTTVVVGQDGQQHVVTAALSPDLMQDVQKLLERASEERKEEVPCVGFHCLVNPKDELGGSEDSSEEQNA